MTYRIVTSRMKIKQDDDGIF